MTYRIHDKIRAILAENPHLTQKGLAARMGLNPAAVNRMLYGRRNIMADEIPVIEAYLGQRLAPATPAAAKADQPPLPVYGCDTGRGTTADWVEGLPSQAGIRDAFAVYAAGDEMRPRYFAGECVYIHPGRPPRDGQDVLLEMKDGTLRLRTLVSRSERKLRLRQYHPAREEDLPLSQVQAIFTVIGRS